jgi:hypothetical protein
MRAGRAERSGWGRAAPGALLAVGLAALVAACGGSGPPAAQATRAGARDASVQEIIQCFRQHGLPNYPDAVYDPNDGRWHLPDHRPDLPVSVQQACSALLPQVTQGPPVPNADFQRLVRFAVCARRHGFPDWPDPRPDGVFVVSGKILDSPDAPKGLKTNLGPCASVLPGGRFPGIVHG